jgi:uncharacterized protein (DUF488 family)
MADEGLQVLTIGHSTRPLGELLDLLERHGCGTVIDVRSLPRSRRYPQFNREPLAAALEERGISYRHCAPLGGLRRPLDPRESVNRGLRNERFRAYADHMQTAEFADAVDRLMDLARTDLCAVMCAEAVPWRCHRSLLADALTARGCRVLHVIDRNRVEEHRFRKEAVVADGKVSYPADPGQRRLDL